MEEAGTQVLAESRRYIIKRPRLTRLLDESKARILMLVAPAGYGKTTLAREWLENREHGWYRGVPASADVAALAVGLAEATGTVIPGAGRRMRERLRVTANPERDVQPLAELLAEDLADWPETAWLAIDDYHFASDSEASERYVDLLASLSPVRLLLATRKRPAWATSRRILYGEIHELGMHDLAMTQEEARELFMGKEIPETPGLAALTGGWPAVLGLAASSPELIWPEGEVPESLHEYFAQELFNDLDLQTQVGIAKLALLPSITPEVATLLLGTTTRFVLAEGVRVGILTTTHESFDLHPLLRTFLESRLRELPPQTTVEATGPLARHFIDRDQWDDAFAVIERAGDDELFLTLLRESLSSLLRQTRLPTINRWLEYARGRCLISPVVDLVEAENAFRDGDNLRAQALAVEAARRLDDASPLKVGALCLGGLAAHLRSRDDDALRFYSQARSLSLGTQAESEAIWGQFLAAFGLGYDDTSDYFRDYESKAGTTPNVMLRCAGGRLWLGAHDHDMYPGVDLGDQVVHLLSRADDPIIRCGFLNAYASALIVVGRYGDARTVADREIQEATTYRLGFALPHAYVYRAAAAWGLRAFGECERLLDVAEGVGMPNAELQVNLMTVRARQYLATGAASEAVASLEAESGRSSSPAMDAEYRAWWALALACCGKFDEAAAVLALALPRAGRVEVRALAACIEAVAALEQNVKTAPRVIKEAFEEATTMGNVDALVATYRAVPDILVPIAADTALWPRLVPILRNARDEALAKRAGLTLPRRRADGEGTLSPREQEVYELLGRGCTNKEIARALFIEESTVKVHLRRIFEKTGARSRTEAAVHAAMRVLH